MLTLRKMKQKIYENLRKTSIVITEADRNFCLEHNLVLSQLLREKIQERRALGLDFSLPILKKRLDENAAWLSKFSQAVASKLTDGEYREIVDWTSSEVKKSQGGEV